MKILKKEIELCEDCNNYKGFVKEEYNDHVPVHCSCGLERERKDHGGWRSPCMICPNGDKLWWTPISYHTIEGGETRSTSHFFGPNMNKRNKE